MELAAHHEIGLVVTQPEKGRGRGRRRPVAEAAIRLGLPVLAPARAIDAAGGMEAVGATAAAVVAYGQILPAGVLDLFPQRMVNLHFSVLPRWRGAAPVERAILAGDTATGITTIVLDEGMDTGPILDQVGLPIEPGERAGELTERLAVLGAPLLRSSIEGLVAGTLTTRPQPAEGATTAPKLRPAEGRISWKDPAADIVRRVRAFQPRPGAFTTFRGRRLEVRNAHEGEPCPAAAEGALATEPLRAAARDRWVVLTEVQLEGRRPVSGDDFTRGARVAPGDAVV